MDGNHVVLDISSDEDVGFDWPATDGCDSEIDWTELFVNLERDSGGSQNPEKDYDSDDVVVVKEVFAKPKRTKNSSGVHNLAAHHREEDDDDCVILDGDPDKPVAEDQNSGYDSDDLVIVSEKGQVACRDYPHPRHLCVQFPFGSTLHSEHCKLCHCYVCDSPAPCGNWGNGISVTDHCHATEKEELWKSERKRIKLEGNPPVVRHAEKPFWDNEILFPVPAPIPERSWSGPNPKLPQQTSTYDPPNIIRSQKSCGLSGRGRYSSNQVYQHPIIPCTNNLQKARVSSLTSHAVTSSPVLKRPRPLGRAGGSVTGIHLASKQAKSNGSFNGFVHGYTNNSVGNNDGDVSLPSQQNSSAENTSKRINAGPTPSQGQATQAQVYSQPTDQATGNLNENVSSPVTSNPHGNTSQQNQTFAGASDLEGREQLPLTEEQSWSCVNDLPNWEGLDSSVLNELSALDADCLWTHF
ncbi:hypothetical protein V2J09_005142 [Rumex salicifolius]